MKLHIALLTTLTVMAGQAQALTLADIAAKRALPASNPYKLIEIYFSGSSTLSDVIGAIFKQNCVDGSLDTYISDFTDVDLQPEAVYGAAVKAYSCRIIEDTGSVKNAFGPAFSGRYVVFQKSDHGGSGNGVFPVAYNKALPFLNLTAPSCVELVCKSNGFRKAPDGGVSDLPPEAFNPEQNRPRDPVDFTDVSLFPNVSRYTFHSEGVVNIIFGLAVSKPLYAALQADQGLPSTARPTVPSAVIASMLSSSFDPAISWKALLPNSPAVNVRQVNICAGSSGSAHQAAANAFFLEYPRNSLSLFPATNAANSEFGNDYANIVNSGTIMVFESRLINGVIGCLNAANNTSSFAIGNVPLGYSEWSSWRFASIDGAVPSRDNAKNGHYQYIFQSNIQINSASSATNKQLLYGLIKAVKKPGYLNASSYSAQNGVMALPTATDCAARAFGNYVTGSSAEKFCSRVIKYSNDEPVFIMR